MLNDEKVFLLQAAESSTRHRVEFHYLDLFWSNSSSWVSGKSLWTAFETLPHRQRIHSFNL